MVSFVEVTNVVGEIDIGQELDLRAVEELLHETEQVTGTTYEPAENHWLQSRFTVPNIEISWYVAFYRSGTCTIAGCDSIERLENVASSVIQALEPILGERNPPVRTTNIVGMFSLDFSIDLTHAAISLGLERVEYEPEQFPGLIYRSDSVSGVVLIFASGKAVITGLSSREKMNQTAKKVRREFREISK